MKLFGSGRCQPGGILQAPTALPNQLTAAGSKLALGCVRITLCCPHGALKPLPRSESGHRGGTTPSPPAPPPPSPPPMSYSTPAALAEGHGSHPGHQIPIPTAGPCTDELREQIPPQPRVCTAGRGGPGAAGACPARAAGAASGGVPGGPGQFGAELGSARVQRRPALLQQLPGETQAARVVAVQGFGVRRAQRPRPPLLPAGAGRGR